jgi:hypothetical protein
LQGELIAFFAFKSQNKNCFSGLAAVEPRSQAFQALSKIYNLLAVAIKTSGCQSQPSNYSI